jgi:hypothetical protein
MQIDRARDTAQRSQHVIFELVTHAARTLLPSRDASEPRGERHLLALALFVQLSALHLGDEIVQRVEARQVHRAGLCARDERAGSLTP